MENLRPRLFRASCLWAGILITSAAGALTSAQAGEIAPRTERVSYADLNLTNPAGQATLATRVGHAVDRVCGGRHTSRDLQTKTAFRRCSALSMASAQARMAEAIAAARLIPSVEISLDVTESPGTLSGLD